MKDDLIVILTDLVGDDDLPGGELDEALWFPVYGEEIVLVEVSQVTQGEPFVLAQDLLGVQLLVEVPHKDVAAPTLDLGRF